MDSAGDRRSDRSSVADEKGNPFVSFSRLVDQQIQSALHTIFDLPSSFTRSGPTVDESKPSFAKQQKRWHPAVEEDERIEGSLNDFFATFQSREPVKKICPFLAQREKEAEEPVSPERRLQNELNFRSQQDPRTRMQDQRDDPNEEDIEADRIIETICNRLRQLYPCEEVPEDIAARNSITGNLFPPGLGLTLPRSLSMSNSEEGPDSSFSQDNQDRFREHRASWRKAFEELLQVSNQEEPSELWQESSIERGTAGWKPQSMRRILVDDARELATQQPENESNGDATSELDLYKHFLGQQSPRPIPSPFAKGFANRDLDHTQPDKPSVISTLTKTQRQTFPDGRVYTQVTLKKRFSDGREESTETEHTTHECSGPDARSQMPQISNDATSTSTSSLGHDGKLKRALGQRTEEKKKKNGWFWS